MKIGIDARYVYPGHVHGIGRYSVELVRHLACKRMLLVLDDVRDARAVRACNPLGPRLLCTTFEASIAKRLQTAVSRVSRHFSRRPCSSYGAQYLVLKLAKSPICAIHVSGNNNNARQVQ